MKIITQACTNKYTRLLNDLLEKALEMFNLSIWIESLHIRDISESPT